jgi:hypothetical protein
MQLPDWLKRLIHRRGTRSPKEALQDLDAIVTRNEMGLDALRAEIEKVDAQLHAEENKIRDKQVDGWRKRFVLQSVRRLRTHLTNLDRRMGIYDKNLTVAFALIGKVEDMQAMSLRGVDIEEIDKVILDFEEQMVKYLDTVGVSIEPTDPVEEERELEELEKEILGVKEPAKTAKIPPPQKQFVTTSTKKHLLNHYNDYDDVLYDPDDDDILYE